MSARLDRPARKKNRNSILHVFLRRNKKILGIILAHAPSIKVTWNIFILSFVFEAKEKLKGGIDMLRIKFYCHSEHNNDYYQSILVLVLGDNVCARLSASPSIIFPANLLSMCCTRHGFLK